MSNPQKAKGSAWERACRDYLQACGLFAERIPAGATEDVGDLFVPDWCVQVKNHKSYRLAEWMDETRTQQNHRGVPWHALWVKRRGMTSPAAGFVIMTGQQLASLMIEVAA